MTAVLECSGLGKRYRRRWALTDCTLSIPAGHVVGLVGPNGAGKTTLLNLATGLLAPTAGTIEVHELYRGDLRPTVIAGKLPPPPAGAMTSGHETTLLFEHHFIGQDGMPARHHTQQTIRALVDGMTSYQYRIDTPEANVRLVRGGQISPVYQLSEQLWG